MHVGRPAAAPYWTRKEQDIKAAPARPKASARAVAPALEWQHTGSTTDLVTGSLRAQYGSSRLDNHPHLRRQFSRTESMLANFSVRNPRAQYRYPASMTPIARVYDLL